MQVVKDFNNIIGAMSCKRNGFCVALEILQLTVFFLGTGKATHPGKGLRLKGTRPMLKIIAFFQKQQKWA